MISLIFSVLEHGTQLTGKLKADKMPTTPSGFGTADRERQEPRRTGNGIVFVKLELHLLS